jgi:hypothetical protein
MAPLSVVNSSPARWLRAIAHRESGEPWNNLEKRLESRARKARGPAGHGRASFMACFFPQPPAMVKRAFLPHTCEEREV